MNGELQNLAIAFSRRITNPIVFVCLLYIEVFDLFFFSVPTVIHTLLHGLLFAVVWYRRGVWLLHQGVGVLCILKYTFCVLSWLSRLRLQRKQQQSTEIALGNLVTSVDKVNTYSAVEKWSCCYHLSPYCYEAAMLNDIHWSSQLYTQLKQAGLNGIWTHDLIDTGKM